MESLFLFLQTIKVPLTILHVLGVVFGMGSALISDILFSFYGRDKKLNTTELTTLEILSRIVFWSLCVIFISGTALFLTDMSSYLSSVKFLAKMTLLAVLVINGIVLQTCIWPHLFKKTFFTGKKQQKIRQLAFVCGAISVVTWISVAVLGMMGHSPVGYSTIIALYLFVVSFASCVALVIEKKELQ